MAEANTQAIGRGLAPNPTPAGPLPPRSPAAWGMGRSLSYGQSYGGQQSLGAGPVYSDKPLMGQIGGAAIAPSGSQHVLQMMQQNEKQIAVRRQLQRNTQFALRNWGLLLVLGVSMMNVAACLKPILW